MSVRSRSVVGLTFAALAAALPADAQVRHERGADDRAAVVVTSSAPSPGFRAFVIVDEDRMAASKTFGATIGTSTLTEFGFGGEATGLAKGLFLRAGLTRKTVVGKRVSVVDGTVLDNHIPLTVSLAPLEFGGGWRFATATRLTPYAGAGILRVHYTETSPFDDPGDAIDTSFVGFTLFGGVDIGVAKYVTAGLEAQYRRVGNALGSGGVSKDFAETDLGGLTLRVMFGFGVRR